MVRYPRPSVNAYNTYKLKDFDDSVHRTCSLRPGEYQSECLRPGEFSYRLRYPRWNAVEEKDSILMVDTAVGHNTKTAINTSLSAGVTLGTNTRTTLGEAVEHDKNRS
jgi:hypothetical protein